jgi:fructose-specific phosphotransferase system component IIB
MWSTIVSISVVCDKVAACRRGIHHGMFKTSAATMTCSQLSVLISVPTAGQLYDEIHKHMMNMIYTSRH